MRWTWVGTGLALLATLADAGRAQQAPLPEDTTASARPAQLWIAVRIPGNYSRVEGLPVLAGPAFRTGGEGRTRGEAALVWRTGAATASDPDDVGYSALLERRLDGQGRWTVGATLHSLVAPVEDGGVGELQASLSTFLFHEDLRDYLRRSGWSAFARWSGPGGRVRARVEFRDEEHAFLPVVDPLAVSWGSEPWRLQPLVAEGRARTVSGELVWDEGWLRPAPAGPHGEDGPSPGWYLAVQGTVEAGGALAVPPHQFGSGEGAELAARRPFPAPVVTGALDARRALPVGARGTVRLRAFLAGSLDGAPLPPQFQRALGGPESLPGFPLWAADCGARALSASAYGVGPDPAVAVAAHPTYGCDGVVLFQAEYRRTLRIPLGLDDPQVDLGWGWVPELWPRPEWTVFLDAGRGWSFSDRHTPARSAEARGFLVDAGAGVALGGVAVYAAVPVAGTGGGLRLLFRLTRRF